MPISPTQQLNDFDKETNTKFSKLDNAIITAIKANPEANRAEIAKIVKGLGAAKHIQTVYVRLKKKDYLQKEFSEIKKYHDEYLQREQLPIAAKVVTKALKNKELKESAKYPYVKLVYDKAYGETHNVAHQSGVSIGAIQNAQIIIQSDLSGNDDSEPKDS